MTQIERLQSALAAFLAANSVTELESARTQAREALGPGFLACGCPKKTGICRRTPTCHFLDRCPRHCRGHDTG